MLSLEFVLVAFQYYFIHSLLIICYRANSGSECSGKIYSGDFIIAVMGDAVQSKQLKIRSKEQKWQEMTIKNGQSCFFSQSQCSLPVSLSRDFYGTQVCIRILCCCPRGAALTSFQPGILFHDGSPSELKSVSLSVS